MDVSRRLPRLQRAAIVDQDIEVARWAPVPPTNLGLFLVRLFTERSKVQSCFRRRNGKTGQAQWKHCERTVEALQNLKLEGSTPTGAGPLF